MDVRERKEGRQGGKGCNMWRFLCHAFHLTVWAEGFVHMAELYTYMYIFCVVIKWIRVGVLWFSLGN